MSDIQLDLFGPVERCKTCGTARPWNFAGALFLEPVSGECATCNMATLEEIVRAGQSCDRAALEMAWTRHYPGRKR